LIQTQITLLDPDTYVAHSAARREVWLLPSTRWTRTEDEVTGTRNGRMVVANGIGTINDLNCEIRRLRTNYSWVTLGDERAIMALFPAFTTSPSFSNRENMRGAK
jgi:hypothetical protein